MWFMIHLEIIVLSIISYKLLQVYATHNCTLERKFANNYTRHYFKTLYLDLFTERPHNSSGSYGKDSDLTTHFKRLPCGIMVNEPGSAIINGSDAPEKSWPWQAVVYSSKNFCGGVLLDERWVLTAAHCFLGNLSYSVKLGSRILESSIGDAYVFRPGKVVVKHIGFDPELLNNDIAMVKMSSPVLFTETVRPACVPIAKRDFGPGDECYITGFGEQRKGVLGPRILQELRVAVVPYRECVYLWKTLEVPVDWRHICVGRVRNRGGACTGDSGGPLSCKVGDRYYVAGVTSFGPHNCSSLIVPDAYTKISQFIDWIFYVMSKFRSI